MDHPESVQPDMSAEETRELARLATAGMVVIQARWHDMANLLERRQLQPEPHRRRPEHLDVHALSAQGVPRMSRNRLGIGLLIAATLLAVATAATLASPGRQASGSAGGSDRTEQAAPAQQIVAPVAPEPSVSTDDGNFQIVGGPGVVREYRDDASKTFPENKFDSSCPNEEPCGP